MKITVESYLSGGTCVGGVALTTDIAVPMEYPAKLIGLRIGNKGALLSRDEAIELSDAIRQAVWNG